VWAIKGVFWLLILILVAVFFTQNSGQSVDVKLLSREFIDIPLYLVLLAAFLLGLVFGMVAVAIREFSLRARIRRMTRDLRDRDREINELRALPLHDLSDGEGEESDA